MTTIINEFIEKIRVIEKLNDLFIYTDNRDWNKVENCFFNKVKFDMTSMGAEKEQILEPNQITKMWDEGLSSLEAIHHQAGNYKAEINGNNATAFCYGIASHYKHTASGDNTRTFVGSYNFHLLKVDNEWKIDSFRFNLKYANGNLTLE